MALIICGECKNEYSDKAPSCPKCGCPTHVLPQAAPHVVVEQKLAVKPTLLKKTGKSVIWLAGTILMLIIGFWVGLKFFSGEDGSVFADSMVSKYTVPWADRSETILQAMLAGENRQIIAGNILSITHPSGKDPTLSEITYKKEENQITVRFQINWKGRIMGTDYVTVIVWVIGKDGHSLSGVESDSASIKIAKEQLVKLDEYFGTVVYKSFKENMGEQ